MSIKKITFNFGDQICVPVKKFNILSLLQWKNRYLESHGRTSSTVPQGNNFSTWQPWRLRAIDMWSPNPLIWAKFTPDFNLGLDWTCDNASSADFRLCVATVTLRLSETTASKHSFTALQWKKPNLSLRSEYQKCKAKYVSIASPTDYKNRLSHCSSDEWDTPRFHLG